MVQVESLSLITWQWSEHMIFICIIQSWRELESIDENIMREILPDK
jgi:hypothetical protein